MDCKRLTLDRSLKRKFFWEQTHWGRGQSVSCQFLAGDCSERTYYRLYKEKKQTHSSILMDAPGLQNTLQSVIEKTQMLQELGLKVPKIYEVNLTEGFLLIEDFGDWTYGRLLKVGAPPQILLNHGLDILRYLHANYQPNFPKYPLHPLNIHALLKQLELFLCWYLPFCSILITPCQRDDFWGIWGDILSYWQSLPHTNSCVLYDYHVDNLMFISGEEGLAQCGLLDFQDAFYGSCVYDTVSFLQDARWDVPQDLALNMRIMMQKASEDPDVFDIHYTVLGAQRALKNLGIFARLALKDQKCHMLGAIPRVQGYLNLSLESPLLAPLKQWIKALCP